MSDVYLFVTKSGYILPSSEADQVYFEKKKGKVLKAKITEPRNGKFHRKYFALLNVAFDNQGKYENFEDFRVECQLQAGHYVEHVTLSGKVIYKPLSIAYSKMDNDEFEKLYSQVLNVILKYFMIGSTENEIEKEVNKYLGFM